MAPDGADKAKVWALIVAMISSLFTIAVTRVTGDQCLMR